MKLVLPGSIHRLTGGTIYDKQILNLIKGMSLLELPDSYPFPTPEDVVITRKMLWQETKMLLIDGLAFGAFNQGTLQGIKAPIIALVHHPLYLETGLDERLIRIMLKEETNALTFAKHIVVTSKATKQTLINSMQVSENKITVAEPGITLRPKAMGSQPPLILSVGTLSPRKNHITLLKALNELKDLNWQCEIVGSKTSYPETTDLLESYIINNGLVKRVTLKGEAENLDPYYKRANIFALPSLYEGYGMVLSEALSAELPIITTTGGALAHTLPDNACIKIPPENVESMKQAIHSLLTIEKERNILIENGKKAMNLFNSWQDTAKIIEKAITL